MTDITALRSLLEQHQQEHVLAFWDQLDSDAQTALAEQILKIDFAEIKSALQSTGEKSDWGALADRSQTPPAIRLSDTDLEQAKRKARAVGEQALRDGKIGVVLVAGGQGSRLGFDHPKGMYPIGPVSNRTLFEMHVDRLLAVGRRYETTIPLYLMTSPATHEETVAYFEQNERLGLAEDQLVIFCQGTVPAVDAQTRQLLLESPGKIFENPDGHGGTLAALARQGCLEQMRRNGIEQLFYFQVDNPLVDIADPVFVGHHMIAESEMTTQVVAKIDPMERVGNVVSVDGQLQIIEYSDLPEASASRRNVDGSLAIWAGSIAVHMFDCAFLRRMSEEQGGLPWHLANKKVPYINPQGEAVAPESPNAIKFETFIFDLLPNAKNALVVEVAEADAFSPLKNASGAPKDTPETCRAAISDRFKRWLRKAGAEVGEQPKVEIASAFALDADELAAKIEAGLAVKADKYFG